MSHKYNFILTKSNLAERHCYPLESKAAMTDQERGDWSFWRGGTRGGQKTEGTHLLEGGRQDFSL